MPDAVGHTRAAGYHGYQRAAWCKNAGSTRQNLDARPGKAAAEAKRQDENPDASPARSNVLVYQPRSLEDVLDRIRRQPSRRFAGDTEGDFVDADED
jgi:hypothetical protein